MDHVCITIAQSVITRVYMWFIINNLANSGESDILDSPSLLQRSGVQVWPNWGPLAVKIHLLQSNPTVHQHTIPLYFLLLISTLFLSFPFSTPPMTPVLMFLLPFFLVSCVAYSERNANQTQSLQSQRTRLDLTLWQKVNHQADIFRQKHWFSKYSYVILCNGSREFLSIIFNNQNECDWLSVFQLHCVSVFKSVVIWIQVFSFLHKPQKWYLSENFHL